MIRSRHIFLPVLALCLVACSKEESREAGGLVKHTITAGIEGATKVQIVADPAHENKAKVLWSAGEVVDVWVGEKAYEFVGQNAAAALSTTFEGTAPANLGTWVLVYPQGASTGKSGNVITATLPAVQTAVAGSFDTNAALIAGFGTGATVTCKHLYSGIRFKLTETGIKSVSLRGNNGEKIAGTFSFDIISTGSPVITGGSSETIVLNAPGGGTFMLETWYYMLCLPTTFSKGVTITADKGSDIGCYETVETTSFTIAHIKSVNDNNLDDKMSWGAVKSQVYYGQQNSFILSTGETLVIDVQPRKIYGAWQRSGIPADAVLPKSVATLWGSSFASLGISPDRKTITIKAGVSEGSSLIAIKDSDDPKGTILWSYLIWVKSSFSETTLPNGKILLPPLGDNCYFQWGRKDPLLSNASQLGNVYHGLENSIQNPSNFIKGAESAWDWFCGASGQDATLWGGDSGPKTVWDPCPQGYRVPSKADYTHVRIDFDYIADPENGFPQLGILSSTVGDNTRRSYWTRSVLSEYSIAVDDFVDGDYDDSPIDSFVRDQGLPLRCIRE